MTQGYIYILHFDEKLAHAQHYVGSTTAPLARAARHASGHGARLTQVLAEQQRNWTLAAIYEVQDQSEKSLREIENLAKRRHHGAAFCPICNNGNSKPPRWTRQIPLPTITNTEALGKCVNSTDRTWQTTTDAAGRRPAIKTKAQDY